MTHRDSGFYTGIADLVWTRKGLSKFTLLPGCWKETQGLAAWEVVSHLIQKGSSGFAWLAEAETLGPTLQWRSPELSFLSSFNKTAETRVPAGLLLFIPKEF